MNNKVYFAASIRGGRVDAALYKRIIDYIKKTDIVLTEHIGKSNMSLKAQTRAIDTRIYERDTAWLKSCDLLIAECTCPSLGVGYELAYAEAHGIPVYIFYNKAKSNISAMLNGNSNFTVIPYEVEEEIYPLLDTILGNYDEPNFNALTEVQKRVFIEGIRAQLKMRD
ncbi:MAG: nucleoside 2-deoxyribosyltransferase [Porphyromonas sp.]|nr:nucleoside 2-deoxyribosyltransferase [Porphyromonas sp.]